MEIPIITKLIKKISGKDEPTVIVNPVPEHLKGLSADAIVNSIPAGGLATPNSQVLSGGQNTSTDSIGQGLSREGLNGASKEKFPLV